MLIRFFSILSIFWLNGCTPNSVYDPISQDPTVDETHPPSILELYIPSADHQLTGFVMTANGAGPHPTVVLLHGYPGNEKNLDLGQSLRRAGFNVLFFHYRGAWGSQGDYRFDHLADDTLAVLAFLKEHAREYRVDPDKLSLVGHSMGGFTALRTGSLSNDSRCIVGLAAANLGIYAARDEQAKNGFKAYTDQLFMLKGFNGAIGLEEINQNADAFDVTRYGPKLAGKSVLLIAAESDTVIPPSVQAEIASAYEQEPSINLTARVIPGDHSFSYSRIQLQKEIIDWMSTHCR